MLYTAISEELLNKREKETENQSETERERKRAVQKNVWFDCNTDSNVPAVLSALNIIKQDNSKHVILYEWQRRSLGQSVTSKQALQHQSGIWIVFKLSE